MAKKSKRGGGREVATAYKLLVVQERMKGTSQEDVAAAFGVSTAAVQKWTSAFRKDGPKALESKRGRGGKVGLRKLKTPPVVQEHVVGLKREHETWGTRRISDVLARFEGLGVSEQQVRKILHEAGLIEPAPPAKEREHGPRRFERATPNQMWQSDIFTFRLRRAERLYVCVFMDDHSRFIVGHSLAHHQKSALVMEAFERGVAAYGAPTEVLTDNGRQYTVWRGKTEFEEHLARLGVQHIRSRPQHPQTLGKVERFWKTLWDEFLGRTVFAHVVDAQRRLEHFISHYNYQRPHQALDGLVPADRFFKAAAHVRAEIERAVAQNELRLALEQPPRKPFYVVGQLGDQHLSIAAGATGLEVHVGGKTETIPLQEDDHATRTARNFIDEETPESPDTAVAGTTIGSGRGGEEPRAAGAVGALGREASDGRDRIGRDLSRLLLPARDQGAQRDAARAGAGGGQRRESGRDGAAPSNQAARGEAGEGGGSAASRGADAVSATKAVDTGPSEDAPWASIEDANPLDASWAEKLALLDDDVEQDVVDETGFETCAGLVSFDPDAGWRERGPERWERKLAGADAPGDNLEDEQGQALDVYAGAGAAERSGTTSPLRPDPGSADADPDGEWRSALALAVAQPLPDDLPPSARVDDRSDDPEARWTAREASAGGGAGSGEREAHRREREPASTDRSGGADAGSGGLDRFWQDAFAAISAEIERQEDELELGGPRTGTREEGNGDADA
jgi:transposase InsO family protein